VLLRRLINERFTIGFMAFTVLAASKFASGSLTSFGLTVAVVLNLIFGLWPVVLQRYNRRVCIGQLTYTRALPVTPTHQTDASGYQMIGCFGGGQPLDGVGGRQCRG